MDEEYCILCGHNFDDHLILGYGQPPVEGWMECPVDGCECDRTWSLDKKTREEIEKSNSDGKA